MISRRCITIRAIKPFQLIISGILLSCPFLAFPFLITGLMKNEFFSTSLLILIMIAMLGGLILIYLGFRRLSAIHKLIFEMASTLASIIGFFLWFYYDPGIGTYLGRLLIILGTFSPPRLPFWPRLLLFVGLLLGRFAQGLFGVTGILMFCAGFLILCLNYAHSLWSTNIQTAR
jgi:hypothetical protein